MAHFEIPNVNEGLDAVIEDVIEEGLLRLSEDEYVISPQRPVTLSLSQPSRPVTSPPVTRKRRNNIVAPEMTTANKKPRVGSGKGGKKM